MKVYNKIFPLLNVISPLVDVLIGYVIYLRADNDILKVCSVLYIGYIIYRFVRACCKVLKSKSDIEAYCLNNRVIAVKGKQRCGKSSFVCYASSILKSKIYSNIPFKIKGKFTNKLTTDILSCRESVPEYSTLVVDECNLFYHNLRTSKSGSNDLIFGQSAFCQCVGHFTDGNVFYSATDVDRIPKEIRDNFSCHLQMLEQNSYQFSFIGAFILKMVGNMLGIRRVYTGLRIWHAQHFEKLSENGYTYDLSNNELTDKFKFANLMEFACFQSFNSFEYDDRYMKSFYDKLPKHVSVKWEDFKINFADFKNLYDSEIVRFFDGILKEQEYNKAHELQVASGTSNLSDDTISSVGNQSD